MRTVRLGAPIVLVALLLVPAAVHAAPSDYSDKDFSVRLPAAFIRFLEVPAIGGQTVANRFSSAINPAAVGWSELPNDGSFVLAPYYKLVNFESDVQVHLGALSLTWDSKSFGAYQPTFTYLRSNDGTMNNGLNFEYEVYSFQLQGGERIDDWAVGAGIEVSSASVGRVSGGTKVSDTDATSIRGRLGGLYQWDDQWLAGLVLEMGYAPNQTDFLDISQMPPAPGAFSDINRHFIVRPGVSLEYMEGCAVYLDWMYGYFQNDRDILQISRFNLGADHRIKEWVHVRGDVAVDIRGNIAFSAGFTMHFATWGSFDLGYSYDLYPELQPEFGRSHTFQGVLAFRF